jgi:hypothetical protein
MSRKVTIEHFVTLYSSVLNGLISSANYNQLRDDPDAVPELLELARKIVNPAMDQHDTWAAGELGKHAL